MKVSNRHKGHPCEFAGDHQTLYGYIESVKHGIVTVRYWLADSNKEGYVAYVEKSKILAIH